MTAKPEFQTESYGFLKWQSREFAVPYPTAFYGTLGRFNRIIHTHHRIVSDFATKMGTSALLALRHLIWLHGKRRITAYNHCSTRITRTELCFYRPSRWWKSTKPKSPGFQAFRRCTTVNCKCQYRNKLETKAAAELASARSFESTKQPSRSGKDD